MALVDALRSLQPALPDPSRCPLRDSVAAVSVGIIDGTPVLDLDYALDVAAAVDMNVVMTGSGRFVEVQGTGEEATFSGDELQQLLQLARRGIACLTEIQHAALGRHWPWDTGRSGPRAVDHPAQRAYAERGAPTEFDLSGGALWRLKERRWDGSLLT